MGVRGARPGLSLFENRKKCSNFRKKQPDYVHLWVKMSYLKCNFKSIQEKWKIPCCTHEEQPHCGILENSCIWEFRKDTIASDLYRAILLKWIVAQVFEHLGIIWESLRLRCVIEFWYRLLGLQMIYECCWLLEALLLQQISVYWK